MYAPYKPAYTRCPTCHRNALASTVRQRGSCDRCADDARNARDTADMPSVAALAAQGEHDRRVGVNGATSWVRLAPRIVARKVALQHPELRVAQIEAFADLQATIGAKPRRTREPNRAPLALAERSGAAALEIDRTPTATRCVYLRTYYRASDDSIAFIDHRCSRSEADRAIAAHEAHGGYLYAAPAPRIVTMDAHVRDSDAGRDHLGRYVRLPSQLQAERADSDATCAAA